MVNVLFDDEIKLAYDSNENLVWLNIGYENTQDYTPEEMIDILEKMILSLEAMK